MAYSSVIQAYQKRAENAQALADVHRRKDRQISLVRLLVGIAILGAFYLLFSGGNSYLWLGILLLIAAFVLLLRRHRSVRQVARFQAALADVNTDEANYLSGKGMGEADGLAYLDTSHPYTFDLDFFGPQSIFHHFNRATTHIGRQTFAGLLAGGHQASVADAKKRQAGIRELSGLLDWRQDFAAQGRLQADQAATHDALLAWSQSDRKQVGLLSTILAYVGPLVLVAAVIMYAINGETLWARIAGGTFIFNLILIGRFSKRIRNELLPSTQIETQLLAYSQMLNQIEQEAFTAPDLKDLQARLKTEGVSATQSVAHLSRLFARLESIQNGMAILLFSGGFAYHLHVFSALMRWKQQYGDQVENWLQVIGELEARASLANFAYNNPEFAYPELDEAHSIEFEGLGHPLIYPDSRVDNDITFAQQRFIILTGSNMSGKSTFLRALGVNMTLAGMGSPVCARSARLHLRPVWVSMRTADSLADGASYFFAEVQRLRTVVEAISAQPGFVLLDEILRGTNSDDKRNGTVAVIKKIMAQGTIGAIATHDLEVCQTTHAHPDVLMNKCFEVDIINDELVFDYRLRDGICQNQSATFLMKKQGII